MEIPKININGKTYKANENIKMKVWREYLKATSENDSDSIKDLIEKAVNAIVVVFDNEAVTQEAIDEYINVNDIIPLFKQCNEFMQQLTFAKLKDDNSKNE